MKFGDFFKTDAEKLGQPVPEMNGRAGERQSTRVSGDSSSKIAERLPRGAEVIRDQIDRKERARWARAPKVQANRRVPGFTLP